MLFFSASDVAAALAVGGVFCAGACAKPGVLIRAAKVNNVVSNVRLENFIRFHPSDGYRLEHFLPHRNSLVKLQIPQGLILPQQPIRCREPRSRSWKPLFLSSHAAGQAFFLAQPKIQDSTDCRAPSGIALSKA